MGRRFQKIVMTAGIYVFIFALSGCAVRRMQDVDLSLVNLEIQNITALETSLAATVRVVNGGAESIRIDGFSLRLEINGLKVGKGVGEWDVEVPRLSSETGEITFYISHLAMATRIRGILKERGVRYRISGTIYLLEDGTRHSYRVQQVGEFHAPEKDGSTAESPQPIGMGQESMIAPELED